jgi:RHS repeat-associated protein
LIGEYTQAGTAKKSYGWRPKGIWGTNPVFQQENGNYYFYHNDHLGTPQSMTDMNGEIVWKATYEAFGKAVVDPDSTITNNLRFPGQYWDEETGNHYNWNRYYDPGTGRYVSVDPIGFNSGDDNLYKYVSNNALKYSDKNGLWSTKAHDRIIEKFGSIYGLTGPEIAAMQLGSEVADAAAYQDGSHSFMHAMSSKVLDKEAACEKMKEFVFSEIKSARNSTNHFFAIGFALHAIMDSTSPVHSNFKKWQWDLQAVQHGGVFPLFSKEDIGNLTEDVLNETVLRMINALNGKIDIDCKCYKKVPSAIFTNYR